MKQNQLNRGSERRVMYVENKDGKLEGADARIGWVSFSKSGKSVHYRGRTFTRATGGGIRGNHFDTEPGEEYWISGIKKKGSNGHWAESVEIMIDADAIDEYERMKSDGRI